MLIKLTLAPIVVALLHIAAMLLGWYEQIIWLDIPMHFLGGVSIGISAYFFLVHTKVQTSNFDNKLFGFLVILALTGLAAIAWEILEYSLDTMFNTELQRSIADTMKDLAFGLIGGALTGIILNVQNKKPR